MNANPVEGHGVSRPRPEKIASPPARPESAARAQRGKVQSDRVDISDEARRMAQPDPAAETPREARIEAARQRLLSGELFQPESVEEAAKKLLRSGDLDGLKDE